MLTDIIDRATKWARMKISKMLHCTDGFHNAVGAEDVTYVGIVRNNKEALSPVNQLTAG